MSDNIKIDLITSDENFFQLCKSIVADLKFEISKVSVEMVSSQLLIIDGLNMSVAQITSIFENSKLIKKDVILISNLDLKKFPQEITHYYFYLLGYNKDLFSTDLKALLTSLSPYAEFSFENYLGDDTYIQKLSFNEYNQKQQCFVALERSFSKVRGFPEMFAHASEILSEAIMNAFFDAPVDKKSGKKLHYQYLRRSNPKLEDNLLCEVKIGVNKKYLAISITDPYGSLNLNQVREKFKSTNELNINIVGEGAGLGLFSMLNSATQLIFKVNPGVKTEVIALMCITRRQQVYDTLNKSIYFFNEGESHVKVA
ncbi:MAG: hypothetical protein HOO06_13340 [Bdellovibrionaceae bacterium]|jgi:hypothetical protein|nr:hypothetical protein [Pseudobdellovibrionaceae bacterium]